MASKRLLAVLFATTTLVFAIITGAFFVQPCAIPSSDGESSAGPSPSPGLDPGFCFPLPRAVVYAVSFVLGTLNYEACKYISNRFADADEEEASGAAKNARYVAIRDVEACGGGKN